MIELSPQEYSLAQPIFSCLDFCIPIQAVLEGSSPGRIFVDQRNHPGCAFAWTGWGYFYLAGTTSNDAFIHTLHESLDSELIPLSVQRGERWPLIYPFPSDWESKIEHLLGNRETQKLYRRMFTFHPDQFASLKLLYHGIPQGFELKRMDAGLFSVFPDLSAGFQVTWLSPELFLERGLGFCLLHEGKIVASCSTCFYGGGKYEISVETQEAQRGQGLATIVCTALIDECLARGITPNWECWWTNEPSKRLAARLGFEPSFDLPVFWWEEKTIQP